MNAADELAEAFDQCDAHSEQGERCTMEADHGGDKHTFEMDGRRDIHDYFELTYAHWLTLPRTLLQSMPDEWQKDFVALLDKFNEEMAMDLLPATNVQVLRRSPERIEIREDCENCEGSGADDEEEDGLCKECDSMGDIPTGEERYETPEEVGEIPIPIAPYQRGRTQVPLASMTTKEVADNRYFEMKRQWLKANDIEEWRRVFGPEYKEGQEVKVIRATRWGDHVLPPILAEQERLGYFDGVVKEVISHCLYKVEVALGPFEESERVVVQLHADQIRRNDGD